MIPERRNDVGNKILISTVGILVGILMTISFNNAQQAIVLAQDNRVEVNVLRNKIENFCDDISEIKSDVKDIKKALKR